MGVCMLNDGYMDSIYTQVGGRMGICIGVNDE